MNQTIRVLLVDDHQVVRLGLRALMESSPLITVVGDCGTAADALEQVRTLIPDVVVLDVRLPDGNGFQVCRRVREMTGEKTKVLILTSFADDETVMQCISAGADGYLLKEIDGERLIQSIQQIALGKSILDPAVTKSVIRRVSLPNDGESATRMDLLSDQERRVMALVAEGKTNKEIGVALGLSDKTVKNYLSNLMDKLQIHRRSQAAAFFAQHAARATAEA